MQRIFGLLFSGASVKLMGAGIAIYVAHYGYVTFVNAMTAVNAGMSAL